MLIFLGKTAKKKKAQLLFKKMDTSLFIAFLRVQIVMKMHVTNLNC